MSKIKLLVVDDETDFLEALTERLEIRNVDVTAAGSGDEALALVEKEDFAVALVDLRMPGMSGEELLKRMKKEKPLTEVIILTGHGSLDSAVSCLREGSYHYLQKPCELECLMDVLTEAYKVHVQNKLEVDAERMDRLVGIASTGSSARDILEKLRELDEG
jgi:DNA-binding NtrC family response regulator